MKPKEPGNAIPRIVSQTNTTEPWQKHQFFNNVSSIPTRGHSICTSFFLALFLPTQMQLLPTVPPNETAERRGGLEGHSQETFCPVTETLTLAWELDTSHNNTWRHGVLGLDYVGLNKCGGEGV